jgi:hypothetical protein
MKKLELFAIVVVMTLLCVSCKNKNDVYSTPEKVMTEFIPAYLTADFESMFKYTVPTDAVLLRNIQKMLREHPDRLQKLQQTEVTIEKMSSKFVNDTLAICTCDFTADNEKSSTEFRVKKIDGKWLVEMSEN